MITPDTKNWTWVLERACPECGFDASTLDPEAVAGLLRANAAAWTRHLEEQPADELRVRPRPDAWSPLEYACHVRDVFRLYDERLRLMLEEDGPSYANWDQDEASSGYADEDPKEVAAQIASVAGELASRFDGVAGDAWSRTGYRSDGSTFTVDTFSRYFIHDPVHHWWDVTGTPGA